MGSPPGDRAAAYAEPVEAQRLDSRRRRRVPQELLHGPNGTRRSSRIPVRLPGRAPGPARRRPAGALPAP